VLQERVLSPAKLFFAMSVIGDAFITFLMGGIVVGGVITSLGL
jgi:hypothetical protein